MHHSGADQAFPKEEGTDSLGGTPRSDAVTLLKISANLVRARGATPEFVNATVCAIETFSVL